MTRHDRTARLILYTAVWPPRLAAVGDDRAAREHLRAQAGSAESVLPRRRADRRDRGPGGLGQELPAAVRRLPPHRRPGAHALRRQRGRAAHADRRPTRARSSRSRGSRRIRGSRRCGRATPSPTDFREERGHAYMLDDQTFTERQQVAKQPGTCMHCHARSTCRTRSSAAAT